MGLLLVPARRFLITATFEPGKGKNLPPGCPAGGKVLSFPMESESPSCCGHVATANFGFVVFHFPRVKSGQATGALFALIDFSERPTMQLMVAES